MVDNSDLAVPTEKAVKTYVDTNSVTEILLFCYAGQYEQSGAGDGEYIGTSIQPNQQTGNFRFLQADGNAYKSLLRGVWKKTSNITTLTVYAHIWQLGALGYQADIKVTADSAGDTHSNNVLGTADQVSPEWKSFTIDVSDLTNDTVYYLNGLLKNSNAGGISYLVNMLVYGS